MLCIALALYVICMCVVHTLVVQEEKARKLFVGLGLPLYDLCMYILHR